MARLSTSPILAELLQPSSAHNQVQALRSLKNEIIGHEQKKEWWINSGVVDSLEGVLSTHRLSSKRRQRDVSRPVNGMSTASRPDEEEARRQAIIIVGSLAHGGPSFLSPLRAGQIYPSLLDILCPAESAPSLVLAALWSLNAIADAVALGDQRIHNDEDAFLRVLYTDQHLSSLCQILEQVSARPIIQEQISLTASLISKTCNTESRRKQLRFCGILDALATRLASHIVSPAFSAISGSVPIANTGIQPAGPKARLETILQAVCTIIQDSKIRASWFCCSAAFASIFPIDKDPYSWRVPPAQNGKLEHSNASLETILPPLALHGTGKVSSYPPMSSFATWGKQQCSYRSGFGPEATSMEGLPRDDDETPLVPWLLEVVRIRTGMTRLMAIWLIALLYRADCISTRREKSLSMLLVPILVGMLDRDVKPLDNEEMLHDTSPAKIAARTMAQKTPRILALLIAENEDFQRAAADADIVKKLSQMLKQSYDPIPASSTTPMWKPEEPNAVSENTGPSGSSRLGPSGLQPVVYHTLQMREAALTALAAMSTTKDEYRKAIIDNGVVPFIIASLKRHDQPDGSEEDTKEPRESEQRLANPTSILIAACTTARALSRSVGSLRTILVDAGLAKPIYELLKHPELEVKIAATSAVINIILEFSSMREGIIEEGVLKVLCQHAHSVNHKLRLNAVWALKHLVLSASIQLKQECVTELGVGWLKQIICNGTEESGTDSRRGSAERGNTPILGTSNAAGEQVDLLNAMDDRSANSSLNQDDDDDDEVNMVDSVGPLSRSERHRGSRFATVQATDYSPQHDPCLKMNDVNDQAAQSAQDDLAIQEQGLALVRNLICGPGAYEMVEFLFENLGQDKVFEMLTNLLKPKSVDVYSNNRRPGGGPPKLVPPPTEIVTAVCYILVHLAGSHPKHRQLLIAKPELLRLMVPLFNHRNSNVRVCCVWTVINLTWTGDQADKIHSKNRANELRKLGVLKKLQELENDAEQDVRERTRLAITQMTEHLW